MTKAKRILGQMQAEFARQIEIGSDLNAIDDGTGSVLLQFCFTLG